MSRWRASRALRWTVAAAMALIVAVTSFVLARTADAAAPAPAPSTMPVAAAECDAVSFTGFGQAPADQLRGGSCRKFTTTTYTAYLARAADANNTTLASAVYDGGGRLACAVIWCDLGVGTFYLVVDPGQAEPHTEPFRATVVNLLEPGCQSATGQGFSADHRGAFTAQGEVQCLQLPTPSGRYQVTLPPGDANNPLVQLVQNQNARMCSTAVTAWYGCDVQVPQPTRLIVVAQGARTAGEYRLALQRTTDYNDCAGMGPGRPGAVANATVPLSATDYVTCFAVPAAGEWGNPEILTLDRVSGDGTASLSVYNNFNGQLVCQDQNAAAFQQIGCELGGTDHTVVVRSATGSGQFRISQVTGISAACTAAASTTFGGPATTGTINDTGDVRCYQVPANSWVDTANAATIRYLDQDGELRTCSTQPCLVPFTEVLVTSPEPVTYRLDTWAVGFDYAAPADCAVITDTTAYDFGPVTGTFSATDRAHCVSVPLGFDDQFRVTAQNAEPYLINGGQVISRCTAVDATTWTCAPKPNSVSGRALVAFIAKADGPFRAEAECLTPLCGGIYFGLGSNPAGGPTYTLTAGTTSTFTMNGVGLHQRDTLWLTRGEQRVAPIVVRSVSPNRDVYTADIDLTGIEPGTYDVTATSFASPNYPLTFRDLIGVQPGQPAPPTQVKATVKPSIKGKAAVGLTLTVNPGTWTPAVTSYRYQWNADGVAIPRTTGASYPIPMAMRGKRLTVTVTGIRAGYQQSSATSAPVTVDYGVAPKATVKPKILGTAKSGATVRASAGTWTPTASSYRYEWRVAGKVVGTGTSLKLAKAWATKPLTLTVIAKRTGHLDGRAVSATATIKK